MIGWGQGGKEGLLHALRAKAMFVAMQQEYQRRVAELQDVFPQIQNTTIKMLNIVAST